MKTDSYTTPRPAEPCCPELPELRRLQYFDGRLLRGQDFRDEQSYFREKLKLGHRCLDGYGVVCGLEVRPEPRPEPCEPEEDRKRQELDRRLGELEAKGDELEKALAGEADADRKAELERQLAGYRGRREELQGLLDDLCPPAGDERATRVVVECGIAWDCLGNEIVLRRPVAVDLWHTLSAGDRRRLKESYGGEALPLYLSICFCELPVEPVRPIHGDSCDPPSGCRHAKLQDSYRLRVTLEPPAADERCEACCCSCQDPCLLLARIDGFRPGRPLERDDIHNEVRRMLALYDWTTITGVSWVHGGRYTEPDAAYVLGRGGQGAGLEVRLSREVQTSTLKPGVVVVTVHEDFLGGSGRGANIYNVTGEIVLPPGPTTDRLIWRQTSDDRFHQGDMVLIQVKADFILDRCCHPVDGNHRGGRVPLLLDAGGRHPQPEIEGCLEPPGRPGPWRSGNGSGGGLFESWIFIQ